MFSVIQSITLLIGQKAILLNQPQETISESEGVKAAKLFLALYSLRRKMITMIP